ncbi:hypothetical protein DFJ74DRAFT_712898 [Hyaloraphidium curvatum]|nr:hypothetical protein DFJ74DRAFT_712898 [Hyaloraphidium curvatum]
MESPPALRLTAAEESALFPAGAAGPDPKADPNAIKVEDGGAGTDPLALDASALVDGLSQDPFLRFVTRLHLALAGAARWTGYRLAAVAVSEAALIAATWALNNQSRIFSTRHLAAYTAANGLWSAFCVCIGLLGTVAVFGFRFVSEPQAAAHPMATLVRWRQLVQAGSALVAHAPNDKLCPCPADSCSGALPKQATALRALAPLGPLVAELLGDFFLIYTLSFTFRAQLWTSGWEATVIAFGVLLYGTPTHFINVWNTPSTALLRLQGRLRYRAMDLMLRDTLAHLELCTATNTPPRLPADEPYISLHFSLSQAWPSELAHISSGRAGLVALFFPLLVGTIVSASVASCIPLWILFFALCVLVILVQEMLNVAAANAEIDRVASLYRTFRTKILVFLARNPTEPIALALRGHAELLSAFERTDEVQGTFLGFRVRYSVVRGFLATVLTIAVGLWSLLRGADVNLTPETVCPG